MTSPSGGSRARNNPDITSADRCVIVVRDATNNAEGVVASEDPALKGLGYIRKAATPLQQKPSLCPRTLSGDPPAWSPMPTKMWVTTRRSRRVTGVSECFGRTLDTSSRRSRRPRTGEQTPDWRRTKSGHRRDHFRRAHTLRDAGLRICPPGPGGPPCQHLLQLPQFPLESAGKNRKPAPGFRIEILVIQMKRRSVTFALPLIAGPETKEPGDPESQLLADTYPDKPSPDAANTSSGTSLSRIAARSIASSTSYGIRSASSVCRAASGRNSAVGCCSFTARRAGKGPVAFGP